MMPSINLTVGAQQCRAPATKVSTFSGAADQTNPVVLSEAIEDSGLAGKDPNVRTCEEL